MNLLVGDPFPSGRVSSIKRIGEGLQGTRNLCASLVLNPPGKLKSLKLNGFGFSTATKLARVAIPIFWMSVVK
jgi:hypothetical protein